jgi:hypothetical protein
MGAAEFLIAPDELLGVATPLQRTIGAILTGLFRCPGDSESQDNIGPAMLLAILCGQRKALPIGNTRV